MCSRLTWLIGQLRRSSQASSLMSEVSWPVSTRAMTSSSPLPLCCLFWLARRSDTSSLVTCRQESKLKCCLAASARAWCSASRGKPFSLPALQTCKEEKRCKHKQTLGLPVLVGQDHRHLQRGHLQVLHTDSFAVYKESHGHLLAAAAESHQTS